MSLTDDQVREVQDVAWIVIEKAFKTHIKTCPHGKNILIGKWLIIGVVFGSSIASGGAAAIVFKLLATV